MPRILAAVAISLIAGFALGAWLMGNAPTSDDSAAAARGGDTALSYPIEGRLVKLEQALAAERNARNILEEQLQILIADVERVESLSLRGFPEEAPDTDEARSERQAERRRQRDFARMVGDFQQRRLMALVDGGFPEDEARQVLRQESQAQYEAMQAAHEAQRRGESVDPAAAMTSPQSLLRAALGDNDYERYLEAQGQPTAIQVTQVLEGSAGSQAGLQTGDQIVSYNGERVFNVSDLRTLTLQGRLGEDAVIEIDRDGVRMQLGVPRGPVGITGSGANVRNMNWWGGG